MKLRWKMFSAASLLGISNVCTSCEKTTEPIASDLKMDIGYYSVIEAGTNDTNFWYFDADNKYESLFGKDRNNWYAKGTYRFSITSFCKTVLSVDTAMHVLDIDTSFKCSRAKNVRHSYFEIEAETNEVDSNGVKKEIWLVGNKIP